jgi:hypothetical protein
MKDVAKALEVVEGGCFVCRCCSVTIVFILTQTIVVLLSNQKYVTMATFDRCRMVNVPSGLGLEFGVTGPSVGGGTFLATESLASINGSVDLDNIGNENAVQVDGSVDLDNIVNGTVEALDEALNESPIEVLDEALSEAVDEFTEPSIVIESTGTADGVDVPSSSPAPQTNSTADGVDSPASQMNSTGALILISGDCDVDGDCVSSPSFPTLYYNEGQCQISVVVDGGSNCAPLVLEHFSIGNSGLMRINNQSFSGENSPSIVPQGTIEWEAAMGSAGSWRMCLPPVDTPCPGTAPPDTADDLQATLTVTSGDCLVDGDCVMSPDYPAEYPPNGHCQIDVIDDNSAALVFEAFNTERGYDKLRITPVGYTNSRLYSGTLETMGYLIGTVPQGTIEWESDGGTEDLGWRICLPRATTTTPRPPQSPEDVRTTTRGCACRERAAWPERTVTDTTLQYCDNDDDSHCCPPVPPDRWDSNDAGLREGPWCYVEDEECEGDEWGPTQMGLCSFSNVPWPNSTRAGNSIHPGAREACYNAWKEGPDSHTADFGTRREMYTEDSGEPVDMPEMCWDLWRQYAPFSPETPVVCACEENVWATEALVSDLPPACINHHPESSFSLSPGDWNSEPDPQRSLLYGQRFIFLDAKDRMSGFLMALPACCWFVLRLMGLASEAFFSMAEKEHGKKNSCFVSGLLWICLSMAPSALIRFFLELHIAESNPNLVFAPWSSTTQWVAGFALLFCCVVFCYLFLNMSGAFEGDSQGDSIVSNKIFRHCCCLCCLGCWTLPWFLWELSWTIHVNSFTFGLNLQILLNFPEISLSMRISALRFIAFFLTLLDVQHFFVKQVRFVGKNVAGS